jgi:O-antigen/teichoic acid export membrane protein
MSIKAQAMKNVSATWLSLLVHAIVSFALSPLVLHRLGDAGFSVWILVFSLTGYFGLLDVGIRSSVVRYVAKAAAAGDEDQLRRLVATSLVFYLGVAVLVLILTGVGSFYLAVLFKIPATQLPTARILFLLAGASVALTFPLSVFAGVLEGLQKFAQVQLTQMVVTVLRGLAVAFALSQGGRLLATGAVTVGANLLGYLVLMWMACRTVRLPLSLRGANAQILGKLARYGFFAFIIVLAEKLRFQSDAVVIGAFLSSTAITFYSIASKLVEYSTYAVRSMAQIFTPMSSQFHATADHEQLRRVLIAGNRACALIVLPLAVVLIMVGKSIIEVWVGARYIASYSVLVLLIVPKALYLAQSASTRILLGMGRHQVLAWVLLLEGVVNVLLSILLLPHFGMVGIALGTAIPLSCTSLFFLPHHASRRVGVPLGQFLKGAYLQPLRLCVPLAIFLWLARRTSPAHTYVGLAWQIGSGALVYCSGLVWSFLSVAPRRVTSWRALSEILEPLFEGK